VGTHAIHYLFLGIALSIFAILAYSQNSLEQSLSGPDSHETGQGPRGHLFGDCHGEGSLGERTTRAAVAAHLA
jgi:hypothetical protein